MSPGANEGRRHLDLQAAGDAASAPLGEPKKWPLPESLRASSGAPDSCNCAPTLSLRTASGSHHSIACPMWCQTSLRAAGAPTPPTPGGTEICSHDNAAPPCGCFRDQFSEHARGSREQLARNTTPSGDFTALLEAFRIDTWIDGHDGEQTPSAHTEGSRAAVEAEYAELKESRNHWRQLAWDNDHTAAELVTTVSRLEGERDAALDRVAEVTNPEAFVEILPTYVRVLLANAKAESEARVAALTAELEFGRGVLVDTRTKLFAWADKYESALRAIADQHNNPHCACVFCEDLRAALGSSGSGASHD